ncbi:MAG: hypothetical protein ACRDV9_01660, partial [Acidimicrobiia bacterium]
MVPVGFDSVAYGRGGGELAWSFRERGERTTPANGVGPTPARATTAGRDPGAVEERQAARDGLAFTALANGFASCEDPAALQA